MTMAVSIDPVSLAGPPFSFAPLIGGEEAESNWQLPVHYPYTGEQIATIPLLDETQVRRALDRAAASGPPPDRHARSLVLQAVAERIAREADGLARLLTWESGLCLRDTRYEVRRAVDVFRFAAAEALRDDGDVFACDTSANGRSRRAYSMREPVRLVAAMTPFNHPLNQVAHKVAPAIAAGAPIVLKPSERTPLAALWLGRAIIDAGLPPDRLAIVTGDAPEVLATMLDHPAVDVLSFTGGVAVGKQIAHRLGYRRAVLELGGNDPLIVLRDADLALATSLAVAGTTRNSGQRCTAVKRILADESIADELVERIAEGVRALVVGDPFDEATDVGTVIDEAAAQTVERRVIEAVAAGATLVTGGERSGAQIRPPVLDHVRPELELVREETFGPAVPILRVRGLDDAIAVANGTRYGLSSGVVSNDLEAVMRCVRELRCGTVNVNEVPGYRTELTPFGGIGDSGLGVKEGVLEAMRSMATQKLYTLPW
jgi:putative phosphonoacetaldehyde dehydrogenase